jgi:hypothetical protein
VQNNGSYVTERGENWFYRDKMHLYGVKSDERTIKMIAQWTRIGYLYNAIKLFLQDNNNFSTKNESKNSGILV